MMRAALTATLCLLLALPALAAMPATVTITSSWEGLAKPKRDSLKITCKPNFATSKDHRCALVRDLLRELQSPPMEFSLPALGITQ